SQVPMGIAFSPDGKRLVSGGGSDESVKLWDAQTGEEIMTLTRGSADLVRSVGFSADGRRIVASSHDDVRVWDATPLPTKGRCQTTGRCVPTATKDTHRPGLAPALGLRAGNDGFFIVPQTNL